MPYAKSTRAASGPAMMDTIASSRTQVGQHLARIVVKWETTWELLMLMALLLRGKWPVSNLAPSQLCYSSGVTAHNMVQWVGSSCLSLRQLKLPALKTT